ncbi:Histone-lysine N-methyltransferase SETMAR [Strongyloides ratti]|uniref:Histone-lysine N-methyltransferase SETMAR n=1 Tax=Strongyloides ratti TaxID=34506 RepID=A0A090MR88_STRRB|nr:Histone-lysine N-methyltransferase SETMAR [Strongyloides ratti]CEF60698.1 Histone-lysine N-methyltransferase SETMAR [Strongyloides ratti]
MVTKREIRILFHYEYKRMANALRTTENINNIFGKNLGNENLENENRGRPSLVIDNKELKSAIESDSRQTVRELSEVFGVSKSSISNHLEKIGKTKKLYQWVPHELTEDQKNRCFEVASSLILKNKNDPFLERIVTCDGKWILYDNRKRTGQWLDKKEAQNSSQSPKLPRKRSWLLFGRLMRDFFTTSL